MPEDPESITPLRIDLVLPSTLQHLDLVDGVTQHLLSHCNLADGERDFVGLAVHETVANAIVHGNRQDRNRFVTVAFTVDAAAFHVEVTDEGQGFNPEHLPDPTNPDNLLKPHGRGLWFVRRFMDRVEFESLERGMRVRLWKYAGAPPGDEAEG